MTLLVMVAILLHVLKKLVACVMLLFICERINRQSSIVSLVQDAPMRYTVGVDTHAAAV